MLVTTATGPLSAKGVPFHTSRLGFHSLVLKSQHHHPGVVVYSLRSRNRLFSWRMMKAVRRAMVPISELPPEPVKR